MLGEGGRFESRDKHGFVRAAPSKVGRRRWIMKVGRSGALGLLLLRMMMMMMG